jgi:hypothetical protein
MPWRQEGGQLPCSTVTVIRSRFVLLLCLPALGGCALLRRLDPEPPGKVAEAPAPVARAPLCPEHTSIAVWERRLRSPAERTSTREGLARGARYLPRIRRILGASGVPRRLAFLPLFESHFELSARGRLDERGLWQLRRETAARFGLVGEAQRDDRLHPVRATRAAARYLGHLHRRYRSWPLALAA